MKTLIVFTLFMAWAIVSNGQQVYQSHHYGDTGAAVLYSLHRVDIPDSLWRSGPDLIWDISHFSPEALVAYRMAFPPEVIDYVLLPLICNMNMYPFSGFNCIRDYSQTDHAFITTDTFSLGHLTGEMGARFQVNNDTVLSEVFFLFTLDSIDNYFPLGIIYHEPDTLLAFPLTYGSTFQTATSWGIDFSDYFDNIMHESERQRSVIVDSWGTLITPYDTLSEILRIRSEITASNVFRTNTSISHEFLTTVEYAWYDTTHTLPVMIAKGIVLDTTEIITELLYQAKIYCPVPTWSITTDSLTIYLDSSGTTEVQFYLHESNANNYSWSFGNGFYATAAGDTSRIYTYPGVFDVTVTGCMSDCLPLDFCSSQALTIEIIDTFSISKLPDLEEFGIRIYPNPADHFLNIVTPEQGHNLTFQFIDIHGRTALTHRAHSAMNTVNLSTLTDGIYVLKFTNTATGESFQTQRILVLKN